MPWFCTCKAMLGREQPGSLQVKREHFRTLIISDAFSIFHLYLPTALLTSRTYFKCRYIYPVDLSDFKTTLWKLNFEALKVSKVRCICNSKSKSCRNDGQNLIIKKHFLKFMRVGQFKCVS